MADYLYWREVQSRLSEHKEKTGIPYSFFDAVRELLEDGCVHSAPQRPMNGFEDWDGEDFEAFDRLYGETTVDMSLFYPHFSRTLLLQKLPSLPSPQMWCPSA